MKVRGTLDWNGKQLALVSCNPIKSSVMNTAGVTSEDKTPNPHRKGVGWSKGRNAADEKAILNRIPYKLDSETHERASVDRMAKGRTKGKEESPEMVKEAPTMEKPPQEALTQADMLTTSEDHRRLAG
jgi:hypothetical protein